MRPLHPSTCLPCGAALPPRSKFHRAATAGTKLLAAMAFIMAGPPASADDFLPPPWDRTSPFAVTAEWEFLTPANPIGPDGPLTNVLVKGSGSAPGGTFALVSGPGAAWFIGDGDGAWDLPSGGMIHFELDNIVDTEPVKHIRMQITHLGLGLDVDPLGALNDAATGSTPDLPVVTPIDPTHTLIEWNMFPNPPWEQFDLLVTGGIIDQVVIDTISVPEPSTVILAAMALVGMTAFGRRRRKH